MNEQQRREYLSSMGYEVYYPRFKLPGAKASPHYDIAEAETQPAKAAAAKAQPTAASPAVAAKVEGASQRRQAGPPTAQPPQRPGNRRSAANDPSREARPEIKRGTDQLETPQADPVNTTTGDKDSGDELRFSLQFFAIDQSLALVNETPHQLRGKENRDSQLLLQAILAALLPGRELPGLSPQLFDWPIAEGLSAPDPRRAASLALQGFINQRQEQDGFSNLLVFSAQVHELLVPASKTKSADEAYGDQQTEAMNCQLTLTHSLQSMLVHPLLKRDAWAHMQALRQRLNT